MSCLKVSLCRNPPATCPAVEVKSSSGEVRIGDGGNLVKLNKDAWNTPVRKIRSGELGEL